tara:strand:+ start:463 stop:1710 length:1248 start_codon:yes stop_codon:yes gene_type:complete
MSNQSTHNKFFNGNPIIKKKKELINQLLQIIYNLSRKSSPSKTDFQNIENIKKVLVSTLYECRTQEEVFLRHNFKEMIGRELEDKLVSANDFDGFTTYQLLINQATCNFKDDNEKLVITNLLATSFKVQLFSILNLCQKIRNNTTLSPNELVIINYLTKNLTKFDQIDHVHDTGLDPKSDDILAAIILHAICKWINKNKTPIKLNFYAVAGSKETRVARANILKTVIDDNSKWISHNSVQPQNNNYSFPITEGESVIIGCPDKIDISSVIVKSIELTQKSLLLITGFMNVDDLPIEYPKNFTWASQGSHNFSFNIGEILGRKGNSVLDKLKTISPPIYQDDRMITFTNNEWNNLYKLFEKEQLLKTITSLSAVEFLLTVSAQTVKNVEGNLTDAFMRSFNIPSEKWSTIYDSFKN